MIRILIVEDDENISKMLAATLSIGDYEYDRCADGEEAVQTIINGTYDLILLDVMLPGMDGFGVVRTLRRENIATPVLMLTARDDVRDKVTGLDCGADDYMTKPFQPEELLARLRALTRRRGEVALEQLAWQDLTLDLTNYELRCSERKVRLGFKEFEVLRLLLEHPGMVVPKETLLTRVWGAESDAEDNNAEAYISFLRKKLHFLGSRVGIATLRKVGYRLEVSA